MMTTVDQIFVGHLDVWFCRLPSDRRGAYSVVPTLFSLKNVEHVSLRPTFANLRIVQYTCFYNFTHKLE